MFKKLHLGLCSVAVFRGIMDSPVMSGLKELTAILSSHAEPEAWEAVECYSSVCSALMDAGYGSLGKYIEDALKYSPSPYAVAAAGEGASPALRERAREEYSVFQYLVNSGCAAFTGEIKKMAWDLSLPRWEDDGLMSFEALTQFYRDKGWGEFAKSRALAWDGSSGQLKAVPWGDIRTGSEMYGYEWQRQEVYDNTSALVKGLRVNNVLLFGDSGTGKSAAVKSMVMVPEFDRLRLIEADKKDLESLPGLMLSLRDVPLKFIIFIDDLSFQDGDPGYSTLKIILEGGVAQRPQNVAIYATSNRRQLVRRNFSDRDDMDKSETVQEKTSLADRFGIRIPYMALDRPEFMALVEDLAKAAGISADPEDLKREALRWEMEHAARTPRTAVQFVDWFCGKAAKQ